MYKKIPLTRGAVALVSAEDYDFLRSMGGWCLSSAGYAVHYGYADDGRRTTISQHRLVMARKLGVSVPTTLVVDHVDRNRLNNTRDNLRTATRSQNQANRSTNHNSPTSYKGVTVDGYKFRARIRFNRGQRLELGNHEDAETAARLYDAASRLLNARYANCNFPDEASSPLILALLRVYVERNPAALAYLKQQGRLAQLLDA